MTVTCDRDRDHATDSDRDTGPPVGPGPVGPDRTAPKLAAAGMPQPAGFSIVTGSLNGPPAGRRPPGTPRARASA